MDTNSKLNLTMLCDFYELTMGRGYFETKLRNQIAYFDVFFRKIPDGGGFAIAAGLEQIIDYILDLKFTDTDIEYLEESCNKELCCAEFISCIEELVDSISYSCFSTAFKFEQLNKELNECFSVLS